MKITRGYVRATKRIAVTLVATNQRFESVLDFNKHFGLTQAESSRILKIGIFNGSKLILERSSDGKLPVANLKHVKPNHKYVAWDSVSTHSFESVGVAVKLTGVSRQAIHSALKKERPTCYGYYWDVLRV